MFWSSKEPSDKKSENDFATHLYMKHKATLLVYAQSILNNNELAEDAVSEVFIKLMHYHKTLSRLKSHEIKAYVINILHTTCFDLIKKRKRQLYASDDALEYIPDEKVNILADLTTEESYQSIINKFGKLPPKLYDVAYRFLVLEMSHEEIASELNITESASRKRLERAKINIKKALGGDDHGK